MPSPVSPTAKTLDLLDAVLERAWLDLWAAASLRGFLVPSTSSSTRQLPQAKNTLWLLGVWTDRDGAGNRRPTGTRLNASASRTSFIGMAGHAIDAQDRYPLQGLLWAAAALPFRRSPWFRMAPTAKASRLGLQRGDRAGFFESRPR